MLRKYTMHILLALLAFALLATHAFALGPPGTIEFGTTYNQAPLFIAVQMTAADNMAPTTAADFLTSPPTVLAHMAPDIILSAGICAINVNAESGAIWTLDALTTKAGKKAQTNNGVLAATSPSMAVQGGAALAENVLGASLINANSSASILTANAHNLKGANFSDNITGPAQGGRFAGAAQIDGQTSVAIITSGKKALKEAFA